MSDFSDFTYPVAKKVHRCIHCQEFIIIGEKHAKFSGVWQGDFQNWRTHLDCEWPLEECQDEDGSLCTDGHDRGKSCVDQRFKPIH